MFIFVLLVFHFVLYYQNWLVMCHMKRAPPSIYGLVILGSWKDKWRRPTTKQAPPFVCVCSVVHWEKKGVSDYYSRTMWGPQMSTLCMV